MGPALQTHFPLATATLLCLFLFVVTVMLFNVLIALLTNASQKVRSFPASQAASRSTQSPNRRFLAWLALQSEQCSRPDGRAGWRCR